MRAKPVIAIDGPAGSGKSTAARLLAARLGYVLVDTGALYRGIALAAMERGISWDDPQALGALAEEVDMGFVMVDGEPRIHIEGRDRAEAIRTPEISRGASAVSRHAPVRQALLGRQRRFGADGGVVLEGRDIGTVVFPDAEVKVFLSADPDERARRRAAELAQRGMASDLATTLAEIRERDAQDEGRSVAPLRPADDSIILDTTGLSIDEVLDRLEALARRWDPV